MARAVIRIEGLHEAIRALDTDIVAIPARNLLTRAGISVQGKAREHARVDRGGLRDSIAYDVDAAYMPRWVKVGSNLEYARATELGRPPGKMPPVGPLEDWARRKGMGEGAGWPIALHIMNAGTEPKPFLQPALDDTVPKIPRLLKQMAREIEQRAAAAGGGA
jgi:hypothetical protein